MNDLISFLSAILSLVALWIAFDAGYRPYRVSRLRNRLFELRSSLFELAREGGFERGFSDPVYVRCRQALNSYIRYAHQFNLFRMFVLLWSGQWWLDKERLIREKEDLREALELLPQNTPARIMEVMGEVDFAIVEHMLSVNVIGFGISFFLACFTRILRIQKYVRSKMNSMISQHRKVLEPIERDALCRLERTEQLGATV